MLESELLVSDDEGESLSPLNLIPGRSPLQDRHFIAKERLGSILTKLQTERDDEALLIIEAWDLGMTGPEIVEQFGLSEERYQAGRKRIRYNVKA